MRGRLAAGETAIITRATGAYGTAAVLVAMAMGAGKVIAAGRNARSLDALAKAVGKKAVGKRISTVVLKGDVQKDAEALRAASDGGADMAFDMVGQAGDPNATLAALSGVRRRGRLVLMGSMTSPMPVNYMQMMGNSLEIVGHFMFEADAHLNMLTLLRNGLLDSVQSFQISSHSAPYRRRWRRLQRRATSNASSSAISAGARSDPNYMEIAAPPPNLNIKVP
jgi:alcohol dehydrogenase